MKARLREGVQAWQQLPRRDRQLCVALAVFLAQHNENSPGGDA